MEQTISTVKLEDGKIINLTIDPQKVLKIISDSL